MATGSAAACTRDYSDQTGHPELPVHVDFHTGSQLEAVEMHQHAEQRDHYHGEEMRDGRRDDIPVHVGQLAETERGPQSLGRNTRQEQTLRLGFIHGDAEKDKCQVIQRSGDQEASYEWSTDRFCD